MKEKILEGINNILGYTLLALVCVITYNFIPVRRNSRYSGSICDVFTYYFCFISKYSGTFSYKSFKYISIFNISCTICDGNISF